ncbi:MAG: ABC transporter substrate-binding protein [Thermodesulfobacteriota bacterium]
MKSKKWLTLLAIMAVTLIFSFTVQAEEGVTDTEIHVGQWGPQTGPAAPWGSVARGTDAMFKMINEEGGIHGRKIVHHMFDDAYNPAMTKAGVKQLQESTGIFAWVSGVGTAPGLSVMDYLMEKQIPWVGPAAGSQHWISPPKKYLFAVYPLYSLEAKALVRYGVNRLMKKNVAMIYQNDDYGKNGVQGATEELAQYGMKLVAEVPVEVKDTDMKPHVMRLKKSGADMVLLWVSPTHAVRIVGTAKAMNYDTQFMSTSTCSDFPLMFKISKGLWKGVIAAAFGELPEADHYLMKKYKSDAYAKFAAKDERWGTFYYAGMLFAEPFVEALKRCGRELTREKLVKELEGLKDFRGIGGSITYKPFDAKDPSCREGMQEVFLIECLEGGEIKKLSDWMRIE